MNGNPLQTHEYRLLVTDDRCSPDMAWEHRMPLDTDRLEIMKSIETLYPTMTEMTLEIVEKEDQP